MIRFAPLALALVALVGPAAAQAPTERRFAATGFDAVELAGSDDVVIVRAPAGSVVARGDSRAVAALTVEVRGGVLHVGRRPGSYHDHGAILTVTMPALRAATIGGPGNIDAGAVSGSAFTGRVRGSGSLLVRSLRVGEAHFAADGSGDVTIHDAVAGSLALDLGGSGDITADGSTRSVAIRLGGSGDIDTRKLATPDLMATLIGSGDVKARADRTAQVTASGTGDVVVSGHPVCTVHKTGPADVTCG